MSKSKILDYWRNPSYVMSALSERNLLNWMSDECFVKLRYKLREGTRINLDNPTRLNEKLQWLMLHDRKSFYTTLVDKYEVKDYIAKRIGPQYLVPTLGIWDNAEDIDFDTLPNRFVLKTNHDSHSIIICKEKSALDKTSVLKAMNKALKRNGYWYAREWPYKNVAPKVLAEEYVENADATPLVDYKFYCYGGKPVYFMYSLGEASHHVKNHKFDMQLNSIDHLFKEKPAIAAKDITLPENIGEMIAIVEELCKGFQHIRVDLYNVDGKIFFGELTFYSSGGYMNIANKEYSDYLASLIDLSKV